MSEYTVRRAVEADAPFIAHVSRLPHVARQLNPVSEADVLAALAQSQKIALIVESDQDPVAHALTELHDDWFLGVRFLAVAQTRRGIGAFALQWILRDAFMTRGCHRVALEVRSDNDAARALYEGCGLVYEGTQREGMRDVRTGIHHDLVNYAILRPEWKP